ncbi:MAG TPA: hypothetical protein VIR26_01285 [Metalysinibacillus sp.]
MKLNQTLNPISFAERKKINENWEEIVRNIHLLDGKISILAGGKDVEEILKRIDEATNGALTASEQAATATDKAITATSNANSATSKANAATSKADTATTNANNKIVEVNQVLADADIKIKAAIKATDDAIIAKQNADTATSKANASASKADVATGKATTATAQADEATAKAIKATTDTLDAIAKAVEATKQATEATEAAITATGKANESADKANVQAEYAKTEGDKAKVLTTDLQKAHEDLMPLKNDVVKATADANAATSNATSAYEKIKGWGAATPYTQGTTYNKNNVVTYNGSTYQAKHDSITQAPPTTSASNDDWILLAQRGVDGKGAVASVDGVLPDGDGNVTLNHANKTDVTKALNDAKEYTDEKIGSVDFTETENSIADNTNKINAHEAKKDNPHSVTKSQVGLGNVDNVKQATKVEFDAHEIATVSTSEVHGMRVNEDDEFQFFKNGEWHTIKGSGELAVAPVSNLKAQANDEATKVDVTWQNPDNEEYKETEVYKSTNLLNVKKLEEIKVQAESIYKGTEQKTETEIKHGQTLYFYAVAYHVVVGNATPSEVVMVSVTGDDTKPPGNATDITAIAESNKVTLTWTNPKDADFNKVKIVRKLNGLPSTENDGDIVYEGSANLYVDASVENDVTYHYRWFVYDNVGNVNQNESMAAEATPKEKPKVQFYGVRIDKSNSNPETAVTRIGDAVGLTAEDFWGVYPYNAIRAVLVKNGVVQAELNKDLSHNYVASDGDIFTEFPKFWWKFENSPTHLEIKIATAEVEGFVSPAFAEKEKIYIGRYLGYELDGKLRSVKGYEPTGSKTIGDFRAIAQANGAGYSQLPYLATLAVQVLYLVQYANLDSQAALGRGWVDSPEGYAKTGGTDGKGMNYGETTGKLQMSIYGIEDFWGNKRQWLDGIVTDANNDILVSNGNFNDNGDGYKKHANAGAVKDDGGYIKDVMGGDITGFLNADKSGSSTTYYCDSGYIRPTRVAVFGGDRSYASYAGAFSLSLLGAASGSYATVGARLYFS